MDHTGASPYERMRDSELHIHTCEIEEWEASVFHYHRSEPTPYRALIHFFNRYTPLENAFLIDYGSGLGRINFAFHHDFDMPGIGLELHTGRAQRARHNLLSYAQGMHKHPDEVPISFLEVNAEDYLPPSHANTFYFFHPFSDDVFRKALEMICASLSHKDRTIDMILYYPSFGYFRAIEETGLFVETLFVDCDWNEDLRDGFWVFQHTGKE